MTNYNDGKWHGWNGGECPVHPKSLVQAVWRPDSEALVDVRDAEGFQDDNWLHISAGGMADIIAFRVIKEHREPREAWAVGDKLKDTKADAEGFLAKLRAENPGLFKDWKVIRMIEADE